MKQTIYVLIAMALLSCREAKVDHPEQLISFKSEYHRELTDSEMDNGGNVDPIIKDSVSGDTLYISLFTGQSGCMSFDGGIDIHEDTLVLDYWQIGEEVCDEYVVYLMQYKVKNPKQKSYFIKTK